MSEGLPATPEGLSVGMRVEYIDAGGRTYLGTLVSLTDPDHPIVDFDEYGHQVMWRGSLLPALPERSSAT